MKIKVQNDNDCLRVSIDTFVCSLVDKSSRKVFVRIEQMLLNQSQLYDLAYFEIDTCQRKVLIYSQTSSDGQCCRIFPAFILSVKSILVEDSMLVRFYNLFVEKCYKILFHDVMG